MPESVPASLLALAASDPLRLSAREQSLLYVARLGAKAGQIWLSWLVNVVVSLGAAVRVVLAPSNGREPERLKRRVRSNQNALIPIPKRKPKKKTRKAKNPVETKLNTEKRTKALASLRPAQLSKDGNVMLRNDSSDGG